MRSIEIVFVCTGNRCRSPVALAALARETVGRDVILRSVGTRALPSYAPAKETLAAASSLDLDISEHRAAGMHLGDLRTSDLVIGFEQRHIAAAVVEGEARRERTFLLSELVGLLTRLGDRPRNPTNARVQVERFLQTAHEARDPDPKGRLEIPDPMGKTPDVHLRIATRISREVTHLARLLFPPAPPPPP